MWTEVEISITGADPYHRAFDTMGMRADDLTEPLTAIAGLMIRDVGEAFASEGGSSGGQWAPLSEPYATIKESHWGALPILVSGKKTEGGAVIGQMRRTVLNAAEAMHVDPQRLLYEPESVIAYYHQVGTENMPARPPVRFTPAQLVEWNREFVRWIMGAWRSSP